MPVTSGESLDAACRRYLDACNRREWETVGSYVHDRVTVNDIGVSRAEYIDQVKRLIRAFDDYAWQIDQLAYADDVVMVRLTGTGTHTGAWAGVPASGRSVISPEMAMYRRSGERFSHIWSIADNLALVPQITRSGD